MVSKIIVKLVKLEKAVRVEVEQGEKPKKKNIVVRIYFTNDKGDGMIWTPRYETLNEIITYLIGLHGEEEVLKNILE